MNTIVGRKVQSAADIGKRCGETTVGTRRYIFHQRRTRRSTIRFPKLPSVRIAKGAEEQSATHIDAISWIPKTGVVCVKRFNRIVVAAVPPVFHSPWFVAKNRLEPTAVKPYG